MQDPQNASHRKTGRANLPDLTGCRRTFGRALSYWTSADLFGLAVVIMVWCGAIYMVPGQG
jgi:hypothetical protein